MFFQNGRIRVFYDQYGENGIHEYSAKNGGHDFRESDRIRGFLNSEYGENGIDDYPKYDELDLLVFF